MTVRFPAPLQPGDLIGVTSPSSGVPDALRSRLEFCLEHLRERGYRARAGECMDGAGVVSAPAADRAAESWPSRCCRTWTWPRCGRPSRRGWSATAT